VHAHCAACHVLNKILIWFISFFALQLSYADTVFLNTSDKQNFRKCESKFPVALNTFITVGGTFVKHFFLCFLSVPVLVHILQKASVGDPHHFGNLDLNPHQGDKSNPDPHQSDTDPKYCK
jgi:hypothetical protein